jgi:uncharacterized OB-fold protein
MGTVQLDTVLLGPGPVRHPEAEPFWSQVDEGQLCLQVCDRCETVRFPIAPVCFFCLSFSWSLRPISGRGRVASAVTVRAATGSQEWAAAVPYVSALVDMDAGLRLPGRVVCRCGQATNKGAAVDAVRIGTNSGASIYAFAHDCVTEGAQN